MIIKIALNKWGQQQKTVVPNIIMKIILTGNPLSTQSIYKYTCAGRFPRLYMTKRGKDLKEQYHIEAMQQYNGGLIFDNIEMSIVLFFKDKRRRDVDNYNKLVLDALEGIVYEDDTQIQKLTIKKNHSVDPRVEIDFKILEDLKI